MAHLKNLKANRKKVIYCASKSIFIHGRKTSNLRPRMVKTDHNLAPVFYDEITFSIQYVNKEKIQLPKFTFQGS